MREQAETPVHTVGQQRRDDAIVKLWEACNTDLMRYIIKRGASPAEAGEIVNEAFIAAMQLDTIELERIRTGWLFTVALRRLIDRWRATNRADRHLELERQAINPRQNSHTELADAVATRIDLTTAIDTLSPRHRRALELRYLEDRSVTEVADLLDLSYGATESLLARARRSLSHLGHGIELGEQAVG